MDIIAIREKAKTWLEGNYDEETREKVKYLLENDENELIDAFYKNLEFGTGGLRGIMGVGTNRMNKYTVAMATQGLANYLNKVFTDLSLIKVVVAYDSRNNSKYFSEITANVLSANNIKVYLFSDLRPTPELSFAIRYLKCQSGIVITASHNPKEYNGYKVYWSDGGQLINPHDVNIINEVEKIKSIDEVRFTPNKELINIIDKEVDIPYLNALKTVIINPEIINKEKDLKIVYTPLHGTGGVHVPEFLKNIGFTNVYLVEEQMVPDGNFPTVKYPNPEESSAMELAINKAQQIDADLVMATDPDADRVGIAIKDNKGKFILLNGNQTGTLLIYYVINQLKEKGKLKGNEFTVKTIVTTHLIKEISERNNIPCYDVLTGFKYIADLIKQFEGSKKFIGGGEESYGYLFADFVRDKDAVMSCGLIAEMCAWAKYNKMNLFDLLIRIYCEYGFYKESLISVTKKGKAGLEEIENMMNNYRKNPPKEINKSKVIKIADYQTKISKDLINNTETTIDLPKSNVLQFFLADGSIITIRPSGTEPKIKFYFGVKENLSSPEKFDEVNHLAEQKINSIIEELKLK